MDEKLHWWVVAFTFKRNGSRHISSIYLSTEEQALPPNDIDMEIDKSISCTSYDTDDITMGVVTSVSYLGYMAKDIALGV
jgi:hypothetical protein